MFCDFVRFAAFPRPTGGCTRCKAAVSTARRIRSSSSSSSVTRVAASFRLCPSRCQTATFNRWTCLRYAPLTTLALTVHAIKFKASQLWNNLPEKFKSSKNLNTFKKQLKCYFLAADLSDLFESCVDGSV